MDMGQVITVMLFILGGCGVLVVFLMKMILSQIVDLKDLVRELADDMRQEDKLLHGRVTEVANRVTRLETRCDAHHGVPGPSS